MIFVNLVHHFPEVRETFRRDPRVEHVHPRKCCNSLGTTHGILQRYSEKLQDCQFHCSGFSLAKIS